MNVAEQKRALRREMREKLLTVSETSRAAAAREIVEKILSLSAWQAARTVALFAPLATEPDISPLLLNALAAGKRVFYPRVNGSGLSMCEVRSPDDLHVGAFGILEPLTVSVPPLTVIDLALVPGVAFAADGQRLGRGKGYYDRFLAANKSLTVTLGIGFDCQRVEKIPAEAHDVRLDGLVTERAVFSLCPLNLQ